MTLTDTFDPAATGAADALSAGKTRKKREAPFSLRLTPEERARLAVEAAGAPLGFLERALEIVRGEFPQFVQADMLILVCAHQMDGQILTAATLGALEDRRRDHDGAAPAVLQEPPHGGEPEPLSRSRLDEAAREDGCGKLNDEDALRRAGLL